MWVVAFRQGEGAGGDKESVLWLSLCFVVAVWRKRGQVEGQVEAASWFGGAQVVDERRRRGGVGGGRRDELAGLVWHIFD